MAKISYDLFDTAVFGTTASVLSALFQVAEGADTTHTPSFTNMRGAGSLPSGESFLIQKIGAFVDNEVAEADLMKVWQLSYLELRINDETILRSPLRVFAEFNGWSGHLAQTTAANRPIIGLMGDGRKLDIPVKIVGGTSFKVNVFQGTALAGSSVPVRVILAGELDKA